MAGSSAAAAVVGMEESDSTCQLLILGTPPSDRERERERERERPSRQGRGEGTSDRAELLSSILKRKTVCPPPAILSKMGG